MQDTFYQRCGKRLFDLTLAVPALVLLAPLLAALAALVRWKLGRPVLYVQMRPGCRARSFPLIKFRTMTDARGPDGALLPDDARLTHFGQFLRSTSLDELPELWNVLCGDMSLVGPRPLLERYVTRYTAEQARRHEVRPGITGWAQVNGRNRTGWDERLALDVWYVDHATFRLDVRILLRTMTKVLQRADIHADGCATMPEFTGSEARRAA